MAGKRASWFDEKTSEPLIEDHVRRMGTFIETFADGKVDTKELTNQEDRLVKLMKEVEPMLDDKLHAKVTQLLCELTAYDLMHIVHHMQSAKPRTKFVG